MGCRFSHCQTFFVFSADSESSVTAGTTETQPSGDYYGDSKLPLVFK